VRTFTLGLVVGIILIVGAVFFYFSMGMAPVATAASPMPFEKKLANSALHARIEKEMPKNIPVQADDTAYAAGALIYRDQCAVCHGVPGTEQSPIAKGMFPKPPELFKGKGVTDDEPGETYWKVANGIRLTGMPSFRRSLSETQMWQVSLLLANADKVPESIKKSVSPAPTADSAQTQPNKTTR